MRLRFTCTRCLTAFAAYRNGIAAVVAKCPGCGALCRDPVDPEAGLRVRKDAGAILLEPLNGSVPSARFRCLDCGREFPARPGGRAPVVCPGCDSGRCEQASPAAGGIGFGSTQPLTRSERKRQRFVTRWHGNFEALRKHADALLEAMGPLEFAGEKRDEVRAFLDRLVAEAEVVKERKVERYLERLAAREV